MTSSDAREKARSLVQGGSELAGAAMAGALGFLAGGPVAAAAAGACSVAIAKGLALIAERAMSTREQVRVGSVAAVALALIAERTSRGDLPRVDFFSQDGELRPNGGELLEGVLLKARDEYEEKKLPYLGRLYGNLAFSEVPVPVASLLIKVFERLTYRQLVLLAFISHSGRLNVLHLRRQSHADPDLAALRREEMDLHESDLGSAGLVRGSGPFEDELSALGAVLVNLADLALVPEADLQEVATLMSRCPADGGNEDGK